jgi:hypothetical protein
MIDNEGNETHAQIGPTWSRQLGLLLSGTDLFAIYRVRRVTHQKHPAAHPSASTTKIAVSIHWKVQ